MNKVCHSFHVNYELFTQTLLRSPNFQLFNPLRGSLCDYLLDVCAIGVSEAVLALDNTGHCGEVSLAATTAITEHFSLFLSVCN